MRYLEKNDWLYVDLMSPITRSQDRMNLTYDTIKTICTDFVNDSDTVIGMQCDWHDYLVKEVQMDYEKDQMMKALKVESTRCAVPVTVTQDQYGDMDVYVAINDGGITVSTKKWLLGM